MPYLRQAKYSDAEPPAPRVAPTDAELDEDERVCAEMAAVDGSLVGGWCGELHDFDDYDLREDYPEQVAFIARTQTRYPALVAEVRRLRAELAKRTAERDAALAAHEARRLDLVMACGRLDDIERITTQTGCPMDVEPEAWIQRLASERDAARAEVERLTVELREGLTNERTCGCTGDGHDLECSFWRSLAERDASPPPISREQKG